jgi:hypothetical protein
MTTDLPYQKVTAYEELLEDVLVQVVDHPEDLEVREVEDPDCLRFTIIANKSDHGKIIGKGGATVGALHKMFVAMTRGRHVKLDIKEEGK